MLDPEAKERLVEQIRACLDADVDDAADNGEPIDLSTLLAEMAATWAISCEVPQGRANCLSSSTTASTACSMPRLRSIGFMPAAR